MNERHVRVLHMVAESYIETAHPVASLHIARRLDVSSATVRNDFGSLEDGGLLHQPHTSAGRIPTADGFRVYASAWLPPTRLPKSVRDTLRAGLAGAEGDDLFIAASRVASQLSGYAVIVRLAPNDTLRIVEIHLSMLSSRRLLAVVVLENGLVRQLGVDLDPTPSDDVIDDAERNLRQLTLPVGEVPGALRVLADGTGGDLGRTLRAVADAWPGLQVPRSFRDGLSRLLAEPEGRDPDFVRLVVEQVEDAAAFAYSLASDDAAAAAARGAVRGPGERTSDAETGYQVALDESLAKVSASFGFGSGKGLVTLIGPARMRYKAALAIVGEISHSLNDIVDPGQSLAGGRSGDPATAG